MMFDQRKANHMAYSRARQRALGRLANDFPVNYERLMTEELAKEQDYEPRNSRFQDTTLGTISKKSLAH